MATRMDVQVWHDSEPEARRLIAMAMAEFDRIEAAMSTYRENSESPVLTLVPPRKPCRSALSSTTWCAVAGHVGSFGTGAFDITYDSVGQLYDFRHACVHPMPRSSPSAANQLSARRA